MSSSQQLEQQAVINAAWMAEAGDHWDFWLGEPPKMADALPAALAGAATETAATTTADATAETAAGGAGAGTVAGGAGAGAGVTGTAAAAGGAAPRWPAWHAITPAAIRQQACVALMALHDTMDNVSGRTAAWDCPREEGYMAELTALIGRQKEIKELMEREMARRCGTCTAADLAALLYEIEQCRVADRRIRYSHIRDFHEQTFHLFRFRLREPCPPRWQD